MLSQILGENVSYLFVLKIPQDFFTLYFSLFLSLSHPVSLLLSLCHHYYHELCSCLLTGFRRTAQQEYLPQEFGTNGRVLDLAENMMEYESERVHKARLG